MYLLWIMTAFLAAYFILIIKGPAMWDRFLGLSLISSKFCIIIVVYASIHDRTDYLDYAIVNTLLWFVCIIFMAFFLYDRMKKRSR